MEHTPESLVVFIKIMRDNFVQKLELNGLKIDLAPNAFNYPKDVIGTKPSDKPKGLDELIRSKMPSDEELLFASTPFYIPGLEESTLDSAMGIVPKKDKD